MFPTLPKGYDHMSKREHRIYNPAMECMDREQLRALQGERLRKTVKLSDSVQVQKKRKDSE